MSEDSQREQWGSKIGFLLASAGSAIGLGNIWRFPYIAGKNGGGAFLAIYIAIVFVVGASVMLGEFAIGRASQSNAIGAFRKLKGGLWPIVGWMGLAASFLILSYYSVIGGWTMAYIVHSFGSLASISDAAGAKDFFTSFISNPQTEIFYHGLFMIMVVSIVYKGINQGIEKASKVLMPALFVILLILVARAVTLPGAGEGIAFYLKPDFSKVSGSTVIDALGQAFYSLSLGMGVLITYGGYLGPKESIPKSAATVTFLDTFVAFLAGLIIFPTVSAFGVDAGSGPGLTFITLPGIFSRMWGGPVWSAMFFALLFIAAITSAVSLFEVVISYVKDELKWSRKASVLLMGTVIFAAGVPSALSQGAFNLNVAGLSFLDAVDWLSSNVLLTFGGLFVCLFAGWTIHGKICAETTNNGEMPFRLLPLWSLAIKVIAPISIGIIILKGLC